jgi:hypothetical protein
MPGTIGAGPLLSPWIGVWELVWQSPEAWLVTASALIGLTVAGAALTVLGGGRRGAEAQAVVPAVVVARTQTRPKSRRGRRRHRHAA